MSTSRSNCYPNTFPSCVASQSHILVGRGWNHPIPSDTEWRAYVSPSIFFLSLLPYVSSSSSFTTSSFLSFSVPLFCHLLVLIILLPSPLFIYLYFLPLCFLPFCLLLLPTLLPPFTLFYYSHFLLLHLLRLLHPPPFTSTPSFFFYFLSSFTASPILSSSTIPFLFSICSTSLFLYIKLLLPPWLHISANTTVLWGFQRHFLLQLCSPAPAKVTWKIGSQSVCSGFEFSYTSTLMWSRALQIAVQSQKIYFDVRFQEDHSSSCVE